MLSPPTASPSAVAGWYPLRLMVAYNSACPSTTTAPAITTNADLALHSEMVGSRLHLGDGRLCRCSCRPGILRHRGRRLRCGRLRSSSLRWRGAGRFGRFPRFLPPPPPPSPRFLVGLRQVAVLGRGFLQVFEGQLLAGSWLQPLRYVFSVQGVIVAERFLVCGVPLVLR